MEDTKKGCNALKVETVRLQSVLKKKEESIYSLQQELKENQRNPKQGKQSRFHELTGLMEVDEAVELKIAKKEAKTLKEESIGLKSELKVLKDTLKSQQGHLVDKEEGKVAGRCDDGLTLLKADAVFEKRIACLEEEVSSLTCSDVASVDQSYVEAVWKYYEGP